MKRKEFMYAFQITRKVIFTVGYYTLGSNQTPYFSTEAGLFNQPKTDYKMCGQCQKDILTGLALEFFNKWNKCHLKDLTDNEYTELLKDIKELENRYNFIVDIQDSFKGKLWYIPFYKEKELSMTPIKKKNQ